MVPAIDLKGNRILGKIKWRIIPFAFLLYFFNAMDRMNIGFAAMQMNKALNITSVDFGLITSVFFVAYFLFQVPSNIAVQRIGARRWIGTIIFGWGIVTGMMFFAQNTNQVVFLRLLLGVFEAGFFPGMIYYFSLWFPARERAKVTSLFMMSLPISFMVAAPISGWIIQHGSFFSYSGWRWLFAIEGIPTIFLGLLTFIVLADKPADAKWLSAEEKEWLENELGTKQEKMINDEDQGLSGIVRNGLLWKLIFIYTFVQAATQAAGLWTPIIVKGFSSSFTETQVGFILALKFLLGAIAMTIWGIHSDKKSERKFHSSLPMLIEGVGFLLIIATDNLLIKLAGVMVFGIASVSYYGPFWACVPGLLNPRILAVAIAMINAGSSIGAAGSNLIIGHIAHSSFGITGVFLFQAGLCLVSFLLMITLRMPKSPISTSGQ
jgi:MFS transporter, ACS family, tartrate transporter